MCVCSVFVFYRNMFIPIVLYDGLFTKYEDVVKFIVVPSFMCVNVYVI